MKYKSGDKVKVINPTFAKTWENMGRKNEWEIDFIETRTKGHPSLYICYCVDDNHKEVWRNILYKLSLGIRLYQKVIVLTHQIVVIKK